MENQKQLIFQRMTFLSNDLSYQIWLKKYRVGDESFDEWLDRISDNNKNLRDLIEQGKFLPDISLVEYKEYSNLFEQDLLEVLKPENCVAARTSYGGPAFSENAKQIIKGKELLLEQQKKLENLISKI